MTTTTDSYAHYRIQRVLGSGVHPKAITRLLELWPRATVSVRHGMLRPDGRRLTTVTVTINPCVAERVKMFGFTGGIVCRHATCAKGDQFSRRYGIKLAFERCLREVKVRHAAGVR